jgi:adenine deaminase
VPAAPFESAGAHLDAQDVEYMFRELGLTYLSEMMNFPGVVHGDPEVLAKLQVAREMGKPVDGHAPGLRGDGLKAYAAAGIATDHECFALDEAREKLALGMKILIREGSAARNLEELWPLLMESPEQIMLCTDDMHPDSLLEGHLDRIIRRLIAKGVEPMAAIRAATLHPIQHYGLPCGLLQVGDRADCIVVDDLESFQIQATYIAGEKVFDGERVALPVPPVSSINNFGAAPIATADLAVAGPETVHVIEAIDGQILTGRSTATLERDEAGCLLSNPKQDIVKIIVLNRYRPAPPAVGFVRGFGLAEAAIASSVAHDSHHIVAVGGSDEALKNAINAVISARGGLAFATAEEQTVLPLPVAGLMSDAEPEMVARGYRELDARAKSAGCELAAPYMTLSFMALPVIPSLKMTDKGLFDVETFSPIPLGVA